MTSEARKGPERIVDGSGLNAADQHSVLTTDVWAGEPDAMEPSYLLFQFDGLHKVHELLISNCNMEFEDALGLGAVNRWLLAL